jgi:hypothetical protein
LAGGVNLYAYAGGNPVNYSDPFGLCPDCIFDVVAIGMDLVDVARNGLSFGSGAALAADVAAAALPFIPAGGGLSFRASRAAHAAQEGVAAAGRSWSTQRRAFWKAEAASEEAVTRWGAENVERMGSGRAAQYRDAKGSVRSVELDHTPVPQREGGTRVVPKTREQHAQDDPFRRLGGSQ